MVRVGRPCNAVNVRQQLVTVSSVLHENLVPPHFLCCSLSCDAPECVPGTFSHTDLFFKLCPSLQNGGSELYFMQNLSCLEKNKPRKVLMNIQSNLSWLAMEAIRKL